MSKALLEKMRTENASYLQRIITTRDEIKKMVSQSNFTGQLPKLAVVLGSGLGGLADPRVMEQELVIPYSTLNEFPQSSVAGHDGNLILARQLGVPVWLLAGRSHFYEYAGAPGISPTQAMREITLPTRVLKGLGVEALILSNASGGLRLGNKRPPQLMLCESFVDKSSASPLFGLNIDQLGPRFPPMGGDESDAQLAKYFHQAAKELEIDLSNGVYAFMPGPRYEFSAECLDLQQRGVDAVGMSTVPSITAALHGYFSQEDFENAMNNVPFNDRVDYSFARRLQVAAVSCITNAIGPDGKNNTTHEEVKENASVVSTQFIPLVRRVIDLYHQDSA